MDEKPWYQRSEFWMSLLPAVLGLIAQKSGNPYVQDIGALFAGAAPTVYVHGRTQIKKGAKCRDKN